MKQKQLYPISYQRTDAVILDEVGSRLLLGKKKKEPLFRFVGGFVDPKDKSLEEASIRERREETGINLECSKPEYLFSFRVDDPRFKKGPDKIMSAVFGYTYVFGIPKAGDDIDE